MSLPSDSMDQREVPAAETGGDQAKKVLIIDDDNDIIETVQFALETSGYVVAIARDGNQGIALAESESPDLIILDMMMPKRSGFLVLENLRRNREVPIPVIMVTGNEGNRHQAYAELLGVSDYIHKPFAMDRLLNAVKNLIP
jgi:DNA-binding response OmpR family regulator